MEGWNKKGWAVLSGQVGLSYKSRRRKRVLTKAEGISMCLLSVVAGKRIDALICRHNCQGCECRSWSPYPFRSRFPSHFHPTHNPPRCVAVVFYSQLSYCCRRSYCIDCSSSPESPQLLVILVRDCRLVHSFRDRGLRTVGLPGRLFCCCCCCHLMTKWDLWRPCWERDEDDRRWDLGPQEENVEKEWDWEMSKEERQGSGGRRICAWWERRKKREKSKEMKCWYLGCMYWDKKDSRRVLHRRVLERLLLD